MARTTDMIRLVGGPPKLDGSVYDLRLSDHDRADAADDQFVRVTDGSTITSLASLQAGVPRPSPRFRTGHSVAGLALPAERRSVDGRASINSRVTTPSSLVATIAAAGPSVSVPAHGPRAFPRPPLATRCGRRSNNPSTKPPPGSPRSRRLYRRDPSPIGPVTRKTPSSRAWPMRTDCARWVPRSRPRPPRRDSTIKRRHCWPASPRSSTPSISRHRIWSRCTSRSTTPPIPVEPSRRLTESLAELRPPQYELDGDAVGPLVSLPQPEDPSST